MFEWLKLPADQKLNFLNQASAMTGYPSAAIEKDWWVTAPLKAVFDTRWAKHLVFKGGTSLSKGWNLIERFSEDIDLAMERTALGFTDGKISKSQIKLLRKKSARFMEDDFLPALEISLEQAGIDPVQFTLQIDPISSDDVDPRNMRLKYAAVAPGSSYLRAEVQIEIGARSLQEPYSKREIRSILTELFPQTPVADAVFSVETVHPERTFYEKAMLLHEEFLKSPSDMRHFRLSRHPYDLHRIKQSPFAARALANSQLFDKIVEHRMLFTPIRGIPYDRHTFTEIDFRPPAAVIDLWRADYEQMAEMIFGDRPTFDELMESMEDLLKMFRKAGANQKN
jgi:hypothetical protein